MLADALDELRRVLGRRIICMQEVASLPVDPEIEGFLVLHSEACSAAIGVPSELIPEIRWTHNSDLTSSVLLGELGVMSAYFADSGKSLEDFERSILIATDELKQLKNAGARFIVLGYDDTIELPTNTFASVRKP